MSSLSQGDPESKKMVDLAKYIKSLLNVHGTAICRSLSVNIDNIFTPDGEAKKGKFIKHVFKLDDGTLVKVLSNA